MEIQFTANYYNTIKKMVPSVNKPLLKEFCQNNPLLRNFLPSCSMPNSLCGVVVELHRALQHWVRLLSLNYLCSNSVNRVPIQSVLRVLRENCYTDRMWFGCIICFINVTKWITFFSGTLLLRNIREAMTTDFHIVDTVSTC